MTSPDQLPDDIGALKAMIIASEERNARKDVRIERLEKLLGDFKRALFGAKSEKAHPDQYHLALEERGLVRHWSKDNGRARRQWLLCASKMKRSIRPRRNQPNASRVVLCPNIPLPGSRLHGRR